MKPTADELRKMPPLRVTGRAARPDEPKHRRKHVVQFDPSTADLMPVVWPRSVAARAARVHGRPGVAGLHPAIDPASRGLLNGFAGALAAVLRHRIGGGRRRHHDTPPTGLSDACLGGEPGYPPWPRFARPRRELAGGCAPCDPPIANGAS